MGRHPRFGTAGGRVARRHYHPPMALNESGGAGRHVAVIGAGAVGSASAIEALRRGWRVTMVEPGAPGGEQATSYGNAG